MVFVAAWVCGLVFGLGLILSGMTDPARVLGFLDVAGAWDPTLGVVMLTALAIAAPAFALAARRGSALLGPAMALPTATRIDRSLMGGSALFGLGWGLVGLCPGPAIVLLLTGGARAWVFAIAMLCGMAAHEVARRRPSLTVGADQRLAQGQAAVVGKQER